MTALSEKVKQESVKKGTSFCAQVNYVRPFSRSFVKQSQFVFPTLYAVQGPPFQEIDFALISRDSVSHCS